MENVIKQGYLKKGNSTEGGVFSGILEKMTPRKWYILVVRRGVPFLEQYERDVDIFSSPPTMAYDLSVCTSISRTMSTTARTFNFVIVCPDQLIDLIAATRDQMRDWCDALERTLSSLGVLRRDTEEHVYTFCPAVSNLVGRSQNKEDEDEDESVDNDYADNDLGAVGGAPPPPPLAPRPQQPPPLPGGHPSLLRANSNDPPREPSRSVNEPLPPSHPAPLPPLRKGASTDKPVSPSTNRPPPLPPGPPPLPAGQPPPLPPPAGLPSSPPPPLPPGRPVASSTPSPTSAVPPLKPPPPVPRPPLERPPPPCLNQQEKSLPPRPGRSPKPGTKSLPSPAATNNSDSSDEDYSGDFVSGAFWEINRKIPIPTARHATIKRDPPGGVAADSEGTGNPSPHISEDLDEGYTDLASVSALRNSSAAESSPAEGKTHEYSEVMKKSKLNSRVAAEGGVDTKQETSKLSCGTGLASRATGTPGASCGVERTSGNCQESSDSVSQTAGQDPVENFYAPFPADAGDTNTTAVSKLSLDAGDRESEGGLTVVKCAPVSSPRLARDRKKNSTPSTLPSENLEPDCLYASAAEASSLPVNSVPPLPKRLDSLPSWKGDMSEDMSLNSTAAAASNGSPVSGASSAEAAISRPIPARRKTLHPFSTVNPVEKSPVIPPLPPRRSTIINRGVSMESGFNPPPLPHRKAQSLSQRPHSGGELDGEQAPGSPSAGDEASPPTSTVIRHGSIGGSDVTENHLRQRMRLDREHSVHSVVSLKQSQAEILRQEMELPGVTVTVNQRAAQGIAFVDCAETVCLVGWNQKDFPSLHGKFHIGDQLISIANVKVTSAAMAQKMLKHPKTDMVEMLVKRIPHAVVLAIRREAEGQNIGIKRNGGTAEIQYVDPNGLAAANGLPAHAPPVLDQGRTTWVLTEINSRHLNLFFKDSEIEHRLNAVGREISIVVQPSDYIGELKKQMKKMKNYKNYIVQ